MKTYRLTIRLKGKRFPTCLPDGVLGYQEISYTDDQLDSPMLAVSLLEQERRLIESFVVCEITEVESEGNP